MMATVSEHIDQYKRNKQTREYLQAWGENPEWVIAIAFYEALHLIEAILKHEGDQGESHNDHSSRGRTIKLHPGTQKIWMTYEKLYLASIWARYIEGSGQKQYNTRSPITVNMVIGDWLHKVRQHAKLRGIAID